MDTDTAVEELLYRDGKRYFWLLSLFWPLLPVLGVYLAYISGLSIFYWLLPIEFYIILPVLDGWIGKDPNNPPESAVPELEKDRYYRVLTWLTVPLHYFTMTVVCWVMATWELRWYDILGLVLSLGFVNAVAINTGHELGHKNTRFEKWLAKISLAVVAYGHFMIDHNRGHHRYVATPDDCSSAAMGESVYRFALREMPGGWFRAWHLEQERLQQLDKPVWSLSNQFIQPWLITLTFYMGLVLAFGTILIPLLIAQALVGWFQLTTANYIEHYGLLRQKDENGQYLPCDPEHSWNSNQSLSNLIFYNLQRHSDHHANPVRRYQSLRNFEGLPELPGGYPKMYLISLFPFWWRRIMVPRLLAHYGGDLNKVHMV